MTAGYPGRDRAGHRQVARTGHHGAMTAPPARARRVALPAAAGPLEGTVPGTTPALRLAVVGESTAAGHGAPTHETSMAGHLARELGRSTGRAVSWRVHGRGGATARVVARDLVPALDDPAWAPTHVALLIGVNDVQRTWRRGTFERDVLALLSAVVHRCPDARVVVSGLPDLRAIPALPRPIMPVLVAKARWMGATTRAAAVATGATYVPVDALSLPAGLISADGLHPSPAGYARWAAVLAPALIG
ncbi:SGNH/GDSL hydrolase family protein [Georgenia yuyongxinii]|uniref:SGNH/GDSL hydrolase family protein n=2 Tax=Georgenia yuyongxinii TaxID=2589797 RepID=A0A552WTS9_9MICO|nr:SGNH/GDSL hydrolase family protein [Georgenia yuyongxinii]